MLTEMSAVDYLAQEGNLRFSINSKLKERKRMRVVCKIGAGFSDWSQLVPLYKGS